MKKINFRALKSDEIDCRVAQVGEGFVQLLLYKNARTDMQILDETVGPENWQREHYECKGNLFCRLSINVNFDNDDKEPQWVYKSDCGTESNTEKEKGESSDSFKRAGFCWNIGRELYDSPAIFIRCETVEDTYKTQGNKKAYKMKNKDSFYVSEIGVDKETNHIYHLIIHSRKSGVVFNFDDYGYKSNLDKHSNDCAYEQPKYETQTQPKTVTVDTTKQVEINMNQSQERTPQEIADDITKALNGKTRTRRQ